MGQLIVLRDRRQDTVGQAMAQRAIAACGSPLNIEDVEGRIKEDLEKAAMIRATKVA